MEIRLTLLRILCRGLGKSQRKTWLPGIWSNRWAYGLGLAVGLESPFRGTASRRGDLRGGDQSMIRSMFLSDCLDQWSFTSTVKQFVKQRSRGCSLPWRKRKSAGVTDGNATVSTTECEVRENRWSVSLELEVGIGVAQPLHDHYTQEYGWVDQDVKSWSESGSGHGASEVWFCLCLHSSIFLKSFLLSWSTGVTLVKSLVKQGLHYMRTRNQYVKARYSIRVLMNQGG
jgi:hypothetical protein